MESRGLAALALLGALWLVSAGCGDDEDEPGTQAQTAPVPTARAPVTTPPPETTPSRPPAEDDPDALPRTAPEEEQRGDEEAIRSEAVFTGRGGRLTPREVQVPAFIAIRVILRSGDGAAYSLEIGGERLHVRDGRRTDEAPLDGLLPERRYRGNSPQGAVAVSATAEPGP